MRRIVGANSSNSCFFRSAVNGDGRKALVQITERCNLHCAHCFVSSTRHGADLSLADCRDLIFPRLRDARVERLTLTGGEPFIHPAILEIVEVAVESEMSVGICTNATRISDKQIDHLRSLGSVHINVSFDGFRAESHGRFRGDVASFDTSVETTRRLAAAGLLQGLLSTPNSFTTDADYRELTRFGVELGADYLLMNPLSAFGRGARSQRRLGANSEKMSAIAEAATTAAQGELEIVPIRFPNETKPLAPCIAGDIVYVFADGAVAVCPYLVFAARTAASKYSDSEFIVGNILETDIAAALDNYHFHERFKVGSNATCSSCALTDSCGKGCPAAVIAEGGLIGDRDVDPCPVP